ncbi:sulfurtransferase TusA family protein [Brevibacillus daliensis]|uniref:sulfurtransferase TusA family protein n=1 Tax=Brevibacillus daliensis TaxID=2892995 RepID=UPI001E4C3BBF|nr:sulfurtransferase TusA family protein [Brevibacillus daliensis]
MSDKSMITADKTIDCKGLACPLPIVRTKKAMDEIQPGQVIEVQATDKGSLADMQGWAKNTGHQYLGTVQQGDVLVHYLRKANSNESKEEQKYPHTATNEELQQKRKSNNKIVILDVREPAEYAFSRIPGAKSIPLGVLEERVSELHPADEMYVVCRTGNRSDIACKLLAEKGFTNIKTLVTGMAEWTGPVETN